jgi:16S rRNA (guanine527-N7)-methyltransferase
MLPPDAAAAQADAAGLGVSLRPEQAGQLLAYVDLLQRWNATYNLTAVRDANAMWRQHVLDCLAAVPSIRATLPSGRRSRILDVGSGGGLPGMVWAIALTDVDLICVDAVGKKAAFIRQAAGGLGLTNVRSLHARVEALREAPFDLITSRAFASLSDFIRLTRPLLAPGGRWVAMKGKIPTEELAALDLPASMFHVEPLRVPGLDADRCLVWLKSDS